MSRVYKAWAVNIDRENIVDINLQPVPKGDESAADTARAAADIEAAAKNTQDAARASAKDIVDHATREAGVILSRARDEVERLKEEAELALDKERAVVLLQAEERGFEVGYEKGSEEAKALIDEAESFREETTTQRDAAIARLEPELVELIIRIVRKLISDTVSVNPQVVLHLIRQGLRQSSFTGDITLRVSKEDYDNAVANKELLMESVEGGATFDIVKDFSLSAGDCLIETPFGVIDSSLDMQFEEVRGSLRLILADDMGDGAV